MKFNKLFKALTIISPILITTGFVTSCKDNSSSEDPTPTPSPTPPSPSPTPTPTPTPTPEPTTETAEEYIKNRTFALCGFDQQGYGTVCGTGWILSDATPDDTTDYNYYIATNWHVKYGIVEEGSSVYLGYWFDGMTEGSYNTFKTFSWENANKFCYTTNNTKKAIDFYVVNVDFGTAAELTTYSPETKAKLDVLNTKQASSGYINKFEQSSSSTNYANNKFYCGGYPVKGDYQTWKFATMESGFTTFEDNYSKNTGHPVDSDDSSTAKIFDISPQYSTNSTHLKPCDPTTYDPIGWDLTGGASGSMLITSIDSEWVIVGIYWGGWTYSDTESNAYYFSPCWSVFNSNYKNFVSSYI